MIQSSRQSQDVKSIWICLLAIHQQSVNPSLLIYRTNITSYYYCHVEFVHSSQPTMVLETYINHRYEPLWDTGVPREAKTWEDIMNQETEMPLTIQGRESDCLYMRNDKQKRSRTNNGILDAIPECLQNAIPSTWPNMMQHFLSFASKWLCHTSRFFQ